MLKKLFCQFPSVHIKQQVGLLNPSRKPPCSSSLATFLLCLGGGGWSACFKQKLTGSSCAPLPAAILSSTWHKLIPLLLLPPLLPEVGLTCTRFPPRDLFFLFEKWEGWGDRQKEVVKNYVLILMCSLDCVKVTDWLGLEMTCFPTFWTYFHQVTTHLLLR